MFDNFHSLTWDHKAASRIELVKNIFYESYIHILRRTLRRKSIHGYKSNYITNYMYLLTGSEVLTGKSQTKTLPY